MRSTRLSVLWNALVPIFGAVVHAITVTPHELLGHTRGRWQRVGTRMISTRSSMRDVGLRLVLGMISSRFSMRDVRICLIVRTISLIPMWTRRTTRMSRSSNAPEPPRCASLRWTSQVPHLREEVHQDCLDFGRRAATTVRPQAIRSGRFTQNSQPIKKNSCSGPLLLTTCQVSVSPKSLNRRTPTLLMASTERRCRVLSAWLTPCRGSGKKV